jgi:hypothetical protein
MVENNCYEAMLRRLSSSQVTQQDSERYVFHESQIGIETTIMYGNGRYCVTWIAGLTHAILMLRHFGINIPITVMKYWTCVL